MRVCKNGMVAFVHRLGLEAPVIFAADKGYKLDKDNMGLTATASPSIRVLDRVKVRIEVLLRLYYGSIQALLGLY